MRRGGCAFAVMAIAVLGGTSCTGATRAQDSSADCPRCTQPPRGATWWYQLQGHPSPAAARVVDVDGFDTVRSYVSRIHARHGYAVCYIDVGTWERWRRDSARFPQSALGRGNGWSGERWLDIRRIDALKPIMRSRLRMCRAKGFDAVEPDNVDGFQNDTGFALSAQHQLAYNRWIAAAAARSGLAVALKNDLDQARTLVRSFDFAIVEQCFELRECAKTRPFLATGKPVFDVEYALPRRRFCRRARALGISALRARRSLSGAASPCRLRS
jgi:hypothetical protein